MVGVGLVSLLAVSFAFVFGALLFLKPYLRTWKSISKIPGPTAIPVFGNTLTFKTDSNEFFMQVMGWADEFRRNGMFRMWMTTAPFICVYKAELVETILKSNKHITKSFVYNFVHPWLGTGLLTSTGSKWQARRKMLTPTFHFKILNDFIPVFNEQAEILVDILEEKVDGKPFDISFLITACVLDIICETAMGETVNAQLESDSDYVQAVLKMSELVQERQKSPWLWPDLFYNVHPSGKKHDECLKILHGKTIQVIKKHSEELNQQLMDQKAEGAVVCDELPVIAKRKRLAFLDLLLKIQNEHPDFTFNDIQEEVDTFMFEGHDTTAAAANWAIYLLGSNPDVQRCLHEELDTVFGDSMRPITNDDLKDLKYLDCIIKETLRLYPSVPIFGRALDAGVSFNGVNIPEGVQGIVLTYALHRDEHYFPDPEKFDPDRFLPENCATRHPFAYVPFSAGPRNCIGQRFAMFEEKVILASIFRRFKVESLQSFEDLKIHGELILRSSTGIIIQLTKRR